MGSSRPNIHTNRHILQLEPGIILSFGELKKNRPTKKKIKNSNVIRTSIIPESDGSMVILICKTL
jgi:hypothetical protein